MFKVVFFDIDYTLLSHKQGCIPQSAQNAIKKLRQQGIKCVIATGRNYYEMQRLPLFHINFDGYVIINGGICLDKNHNTVWCIEFKNKESILRFFNDNKIPTMLVDQNDCYINFVNDTVRKSMADISTELPRIDSYKGKEICQAVMYFDKKDIPNYRELLKEYDVFWWHKYSIDVTPKNISKLSGIKRYCDMYSIKQDEVMAFGDGDNDADMIEWAGCGIAMGNSIDKVKELSKFVTKDIDEDGIEYALKHYKLI